MERGTLGTHVPRAENEHVYLSRPVSAVPPPFIPKTTECESKQNGIEANGEKGFYLLVSLQTSYEENEWLACSFPLPPSFPLPRYLFVVRFEALELAPFG